MAQRKNAPHASSTRNASTSWLQSALKSVGLSVKTTLKNDYAPNLYDVVESSVTTSRNIITNLRRDNSRINTITNQVNNNKYVKFAQKAYKNAINQIKTGNLNDPNAMMNEFMGDGFSGNDLDSLFNDSEFTFGDDGASNVNVNVLETQNSNNDAMFALSTQMQKQTEVTLETNHANMNAMIAMNSSVMLQTQKIGSEIVSGLTAINQNLSSILDYNNNNMTKFIESSLAFYERMGAKFDDGYDSNQSYATKTTASDVLRGSNNGINLSAYKEYVKTSMKKAFEKTSIGGLVGAIPDDMFNMIASNPMGFVTDSLVKFMVPTVASNAIKGAEETFNAIMPKMLHELSEWSNTRTTGWAGAVEKFIGDAFGINIKRENKIDKSAHIEKGATPFDGVTKHAITEIITKELREQTSYLKYIAKKFRVNTDEAKENAEVFNYKTGEYMKVKDITTEIVEGLKNTIVSSFADSKFGTEFRNQFIKDDDSEQDKTKKESALRDIYAAFERNSGKSIDVGSEAFNDIIDKLSTISDNYKSALKNIGENIKNDDNRNIARSFHGASLRATSARNQYLKNIEDNPQEYNLYAALGLDGKTIDQLLGLENTNTTLNGHTDGRSNSNLLLSTLSRISGNVSGTSMSSSVNGGTSLSSTLRQSISTGIGNVLGSLSSLSIQTTMQQIGNTISEQSKIIFDAFKTHIISPLGKWVFGETDENGHKHGGLFDSAVNSFKDSVDLIKWHLTGKGFTDSNGKEYQNKEDGDSVVGHFKQIGTHIKESIKTTLFGNDDTEESGQKGIFSSIKNSFNDAVVGWQEALFGKTLTEEERKNLKESAIKNIDERIPSTMTGALAGAGLLGTIFGGPLGGAVVGSMAGFASRSEKFQDYLFGKKDENGDRTGGLISKHVQKYVKENKESLAGSAGVGAVLGSITGAGLLGNIVGGPLAGALLGVSKSIFLKSHTFQEFLFGDEKTGQKGIVNIIKDAFSRNNRQQNQSNRSSRFGVKAAIMSMMSTGAGAITGALLSKVGILGLSLGPAGPIGGALLGLGLGISAQKDNFHKWLFGEKDENGNKKSEGILGQFKNMLHVSLMTPLKNSMLNFMDDAKLFVKYEVLDTIRFAAEPLLNKAADFTDMLKGKFKDYFFGEKDENGKRHGGLVGHIDTLFISPIRSLANGVTNILYRGPKLILTKINSLFTKIGDAVDEHVITPMKTLFNDYVTDPIKKHIIEPLKETVKKHVIDPIKNKIKKFFSNLFGGIGKALTTISGSISYIGDKLAGVGRDKKEAEDQTGKDLTTAQSKRVRHGQKLTDIANNIQTARERKRREKNEQIIARATNYQYFEDTEENRRRAHLNDKYKHYNFGDLAPIDKNNEAATLSGTTGMSDNDVLNSDPSNLNETARTNNILLRILHILKGEPIDGDASENTPNNTNPTENNNESNSSDTDNNGNNNTNSNSEQSSTSEDGNNERSAVDQVRDDIANAGGLLNYARNGINNFIGSIKNGYNGSYLQSKLNGITNIIGRFNGRGYADGTENASPGVSVVGEEGPELIDFGRGGGKVFSNKKPLSVYIVGALPSVSKIFSGIDKFGTSAEKNEENTDGTTTVDKVKSTLADAVDKGYTAEERKKKLEEEKKEKAKNAILSSIDNAVNNQVTEQKGFSSLWSSIFSKKGLVTGALIAAIPLLVKLFKNFNLGDTIKQVLNDLDLGSVGNTVINYLFGDSSTTYNDSDTDNSSDDENKRELLGVLSSEGQWDNESGARTKLGLKLGSKAAASVSGIIPTFTKNISEKGIIRGTVASFKGGPKNVLKNGSEALINKGKNKINLGMREIFNTNNTTGANLADNGASWIDDGTVWVDDTINLADNAVTGTDDVVRGAANLADNFAAWSDDVVRGAANLADNAVTWGDNVARGSINLTDNLARITASNPNAFSTTALSTSDGLLKRVLGILKNFADDIIKKVGQKVGKKIEGTAIQKLIQKVTPVISKHFSKVSAKISGILTVNAGLLTTGIGLLAKDGVFITLGALNGITGTARLFQVDPDRVDGFMTTISAILGGWYGTLIGSIVDVLNELIVSVTGEDVITGIATLLYNAIMLIFGKPDKVDNLREGQAEFKNNYNNYMNNEIATQYNNAVSAGLIDGNSITLDQYRESVGKQGEGTDYLTFADYNDEQHQSVGSKLWGKTVEGFNAVKNWMYGEKTKEVTDNATGNKYIENDDGTYTAYDKKGNEIGKVSKTVVENYANAETTINEKKGWTTKAGEWLAHNVVVPGGQLIDSIKSGEWAETAGKWISDNAIDPAKKFLSNVRTSGHDFFVSKKGEGYLDGDGSIYLPDGTHVNAVGEPIGGDLTAEEVMVRYNAGTLEKSGLKKLINKAGQSLIDFNNAAKDKFAELSEGWETFKANTAKNVGAFGVSVKNAFVDSEDYGYYAPDGSFFTADGTHYTAAGNKTGDSITPEEVEARFLAGTLVGPHKTTIKSGLSNLTHNISQWGSSVGQKFEEKWTDFSTKASEFFNKVGDKLVNTGLSVKNYLFDHKKTVWYDSNGSYYMINNDGTFSYYNSHGDMIGDKINTTEVQNMIKCGLLTEGEITEKSGLSTKIDEIRQSAKTAFLTGVTKASAFLLNTKTSIEEKFDNFKTSVSNWFKPSTTVGFFDSMGNYYKANGSTFDYYNANGDKIGSGIPKDDVYDKLTAGLLTKSSVSNDSAAKKAIIKIKDAVTKAWNTAKKTASTGWDKFTKWLTGGSGEGKTSINNFSNSEYGERSIMEGIENVNKFKGIKKSNKTRRKTSGSGIGYYGIMGGRGSSSTSNSTITDGITAGMSILTDQTNKKSTDTNKNKTSISKSSSKKKFTIADLGSFFAEFGRRGMDGAVTGNFNNNWKSFWDGTSNTSTGSSSNLSVSIGSIGDLEIVESYTTNNPSYSNSNMNVKGLVLHSVGCAQPDAQVFVNMFNSSSAGAGVHAFIDANNGKVHQTLPWNKIAWHVGGSANYTHIGVEMCESDAIQYISGANFTIIDKERALNHAKTAYAAAVNLFAALCIEFNLDPTADGVIISHHEACMRGVGSNHADPEHYWEQLGTGWTMDGFRNDVKNAMKSGGSGKRRHRFDKSNNNGGFGNKSKSYTMSDNDFIRSAFNDAKKGKFGSYAKHKLTKHKSTISGNFGGSGYSRYIKRGKRIIGGSGLPYYSQTDPKWSSSSYGNDGATMGDTGCGPTAMAMVASGLTGTEVTPNDMASLACATGMRDDTGTNSRFIDVAAAAYGLNSSEAVIPNADSIYRSAEMGPTVLLGQNESGTNNPYTDAGHYVVTDGVDSNGMINIKDPRGNSYNKKYKASDLANTTGSMWGFDGGGFGKSKSKQNLRRKMRRMSKFDNRRNKLGGRGVDRTQWMSIVRTVHKLMSETGACYQSPWTSEITIGNKTVTIRNDCSGFVAGCMNFYDVYDGTFGTGSMGEGGLMEKAGFTYKKFTSWEDCTMGDIVGNLSSHTEIFSHIDDNGTAYVYNAGSTESIQTPGVTASYSNPSYTFIWSPGEPGKNAVQGTEDGSWSDSNGNTISSSSTGTVGSSYTSTLEKVGSFFTEFSNRGITGVLTGDFDSDWNSFWSGLNDSSNSTSSSGSYTATDDLEGENNAEKLWNFYKNLGLSDSTVAGILGNMKHESGFIPNNNSDTYYAMTDEEYTAALDNGSYSRERFVADGDKPGYHGYGLVQWTWPSYKGMLYDYMKEKGVSMGDLATQAAFFHEQIQLPEFKDRVYDPLMDASTPEKAADIMLREYEKPADTEGQSPVRQASAREIYNKFAGGNGIGRKKTKQGSMSINPRVISTYTTKGGYGSNASISDDILRLSSNTRSYITTQNRSQYIKNIDNNNIKQVMNVIINLLESIAGNTAGTVNKLDNISNERASNIIVGGNTTNVVPVSGTRMSNTPKQVSANGNGNKGKSRNQRLAEAIAQGL